MFGKRSTTVIEYDGKSDTPTIHTEGGNQSTPLHSALNELMSSVECGAVVAEFGGGRYVQISLLDGNLAIEASDSNSADMLAELGFERNDRGAYANWSRRVKACGGVVDAVCSMFDLVSGGKYKSVEVIHFGEIGDAPKPSSIERASTQSTARRNLVTPHSQRNIDQYDQDMFCAEHGAMESWAAWNANHGYHSTRDGFNIYSND